METTNEIRRIKAKLKLFEEEGFSWVMGDIMDQYNGNGTRENAPEMITSLKLQYLKQLQELLPPDMQQGKLNL